MTHAFVVSRRAWLGAVLASCLPAAFALEPPAGPPVLSVGGSIGKRNTADTAEFDLAMLEKLPQHSITTTVPWYPTARTFTGVLLRDLLAAVGAQGSIVRAIALNDYRADIPVKEVQDYDVIVAYRLDGRTMSVREKGPLVIMYPFDSSRELRNAVHYGRAAWQLRRIEIR